LDSGIHRDVAHPGNGRALVKETASHDLPVDLSDQREEAGMFDQSGQQLSRHLD